MSLKTYIAWNRTLKIILLIHQCEQKLKQLKKMLKILAKQQLQKDSHTIYNVLKNFYKLKDFVQFNFTFSNNLEHFYAKENKFQSSAFEKILHLLITANPVYLQKKAVRINLTSKDSKLQMIQY